MTKLRSFRLFTFVVVQGRRGAVCKNVFRFWKVAWIVCLCCAAAVIASPAQTFTTLDSLQPKNGVAPEGALVQGTDGNLYGTAIYDGAHGYGTVFKITAAGKLTTLYSFCANTNCTDGEYPSGGLVQAINGNFYGTTGSGGTYNMGTVFQITPGGRLTPLYSFCTQPNCTDGTSPSAPLLQGSDGNLYGTTVGGGASSPSTCVYGCGTVFKITTRGALTTLYTFCSQPTCTDGENPEAGVVQGTDGNFYGTTALSGNNETCPNNCGTVFKMSPAGTLTTLYTFCAQPNCTDGNVPRAGVVQGTDGNFYGTTSEGGIQYCGPYGFGCGTVFKITPGGRLTTLHSFDLTDGAYLLDGVVQGTDGNFYGTAFYGGITNNYYCSGTCGTVFKMTPKGALTTLYNFCTQANCADGDQPVASLAQATNGNFYGTTYQGGATSFTCTFGCGTVFSLGVGLGPFVETVATSGKVGATVTILGNNLTGTSSVSFNGTPATFTVVKSSEIKAKVPSGATSGTVEVTTPSSGTLKSNVAFRVTPQIKSFTPTSGPLGTKVQITGVSLTQTTGITFGGVTATMFSVTSDTQVDATVPTGATTGKITVTTAGGTATSAASFTVTK